jgi:RNA polymerase-binding transcription factor DksA
MVLDLDQSRRRAAPYAGFEDTMTLNRRQLVDLAYAMTARRNQLKEEIRGDVERARAEPYATLAGATPDSGDQAAADLVVDVGEAEVTRDLGELRGLEGALKRLADGTYGLCADCGEEIAFARLRAQPYALRCLACQERREKTYRT